MNSIEIYNADWQPTEIKIAMLRKLILLLKFIVQIHIFFLFSGTQTPHGLAMVHIELQIKDVLPGRIISTCSIWSESRRLTTRNPGGRRNGFESYEPGWREHKMSIRKLSVGGDEFVPNWAHSASHKKPTPIQVTPASSKISILKKAWSVS